ncbi:mitochondrial ubiquitin ligase activator of nfkb 1-A-like isoform X2 [Hemicordylus capensis]|uniref:mitochondrial ubiquitin ligase activator of nfkb 1-A-like isoform X2 n=1 Tax=Hemicordylus capensis TaxID=884348 RepID=UPI0023048CFB|nr:mitochondrial ubiquitin ligase activator of nfkb 1-A-like isoform X2 [Hemicordylus capensis]
MYRVLSCCQDLEAGCASHREETQMDALPITPGELVCLGSSLAFSGLFYYLHRRKAKVVANIQEAPKLQVSDSLPSILSATSGSCLRYVAIEGVVQPAESALTSPYHKELQGVIERLVLKEHRLVWNSLARSWTDSERVVLEQVHTVPFVLTPPSGSPAGGQVSVESPLSALELPLETVYERFQQTSHGFKDLVGHYLSGEKPKGFLETEEMLLVGSSLTGIGELALRPDGSLHLQPPADGAGYFLRLGDWQTLLAELESASSFWKWAAALGGLAAGAVLLHALHRAYRRRRLKQEAAAERQAFDDLRLHKPSALDLSDEPPEHTCIICLTNLRECVLLPCGHVCCCFSCFQALPSRCCPICRGPISRVVPLYQA